MDGCEKGYKPQNIIVLDYDGNPAHINWNGDLNYDGMSDINGAAYESVINATFSSFLPGHSRQLTPEDQLLVYVTDHGYAYNGVISSMVLPPEPPNTTTYYYTSDEMKTNVQQIKCAQMIFIVQCCQSATFQDLVYDGSATTQNRIVQTAALLNEMAGTEIYITGGGTYEEFTYYLSASLRGYYPGSVPWKWGCKIGEFPFTTWHQNSDWNGHNHPADYNPDNGNPSAYNNPPPWGNVQAGNNDVNTQFYEAFNYANCMDSYSQQGYFNNSFRFHGVR